MQHIRNFSHQGVLLLFSLALICSCSGTPRKPSRPVITLEILPAGKSYRAGNPISLKIKTKVKEGELAKIEVFLNNQLLISGDQPEIIHDVIAAEVTGVNTVKVYAEKKDGRNATLIRNFTVLSDKAPKACTYRVIREYPHSTTHFTQGLEFHDGFLYEGTGENGKSAIYKSLLPTGKIVKSVPLDDLYFGEGITILNGKIYQLTYKHQKGFVYDLSDFAVIDSFSFASQEGWGLTNDGKYLIMSDGTENLTWLDPVTFKVIKKVQVVDHQKVFGNLNELEYDQGHIWANVWGIDMLLRIDAATGKVTSLLDLKGILSVMNQTQSDRIDVLNGIAVLPSGNLLVTGKLWPKMFEIAPDCSEEGGAVSIP